MLSLRRMSSGDLDRVIQIEKASFTDPWPPEAFSADLVENGFVLQCLDEVVGFIIILTVMDECSVVNIAIDPAHQRRGYARYMMQELITELYSRKGIRYYYLDVRRSNLPAQSLYKKLGFNQLGIRKGYYSTPPEDAIVMGLILPGAAGEKGDKT